MLKLWCNLIKDIWSKFKLRFLLLSMLMILNSLVDGIGLALLLPMLSLVGIGQGDSNNYIVNITKQVLNIFDIPLKLDYLIVLIILIFFLQNMIFLMQSWLATKYQNNYVFSWRIKLFRNYMNAKWAFFVNSNDGNLINTVINETVRVGGAFYTNIQIISLSILTLIYLSLSLYLSLEITLTFCITGILLILLTRPIINRGYEMGIKISKYSNALQGCVNELINGAKTIKATSSENAAITKFKQVSDKLRHLSFISAFHTQLIKAIFEFCAVASLCLVLLFGTKVFNVDSANILVITAIFIKLIPRLFGLQQNIQSLGVFLPALTVLENQLRIANEYHEIEELDIKPDIIEPEINIVIKNLSVFYDDRPVLNNISLEIPSGKYIAIVGPSGAGKSTLVDCLLRLVDFQKGEILINGKPINSYSLSKWRKKIGYVPQNIFAFNDTIKNNILWGLDNLKSESDLINAAKNAYAYDFINELSNKFDFYVGDRGSRLSGGQIQRIGIARILVNKPKILILDEATSALDSESEGYVLKTINDLRGKMTIITITHRLSTVLNADYIYVLDNGEIVEHGTGEHLMNNSKYFKSLYN